MKQTSEQTRTRDMGINNKLTVTRGEEGGRYWGNAGERSRQGTCIKDPWKEGLNVGDGEWVGESNGGKMGITVIEQQ